MSRIMAPSSLTPQMVALVESIRGAISRDAPPQRPADRAAAVLRSFLGDPGLLGLAHREADPDRYRQHVLHVEDDGSFSVVALVWLRGQATPVHDHVSWCVVGVYEGQENETRYRLIQEGGSSFLVEAGQTVNPNGQVSALTPPGDIHRVENRGPGLAISLHIYGADIGKLGSSIRRCYDEEIRAADSDRRP